MYCAINFNYNFLRYYYNMCVIIKKKYGEIQNKNKKFNNDKANLFKAAIANTSLCDVADDIMC